MEQQFNVRNRSGDRRMAFAAVLVTLKNNYWRELNMAGQNANIDFIGVLNLLRYLFAKGQISEEERAKISALIAQELGANIIVM